MPNIGQHGSSRSARSLSPGTLITKWGSTDAGRSSQDPPLIIVWREWNGEERTSSQAKVFGGSWGAMAFLDWRGVPSYVGCCRYSGSSILNASANLSAMRSPAAASAGDSGVGAVYEKQQKNG